MNKFSHNSNVGFILALGVGVGTALGVALHNIAIGSALGAAFSLLFYSIKIKHNPS